MLGGHGLGGRTVEAAPSEGRSETEGVARPRALNRAALPALSRQHALGSKAAVSSAWEVRVLQRTSSAKRALKSPLRTPE